MSLLNEIQQKLSVPKNQFNKYGGYNYRSCEDILNAVKPLLNGATLTMNDTIQEVGGRIYVKAEAILVWNHEDNPREVRASAFAREAESKKGMDEAQITGAASSYARKYALCGLFAIDDGADPDKTNTYGKETPKKEATQEPKQTTEPQAIPNMAIDNIEEKSGTKNGKPWTMYIIHSGDDKFRTFDAGIADVAQSCHKDGISCNVTYTDGKFGYELTSLLPVDDIPI